MMVKVKKRFVVRPVDELMQCKDETGTVRIVQAGQWVEEGWEAEMTPDQQKHFADKIDADKQASGRKGRKPAETTDA